MYTKKVLAFFMVSILLVLSFLVLTAGNAMAVTAVKVMPLGDSITDGFNVPGGYRIQLWNKIVNNGLWVDFVGSGFNGPSNLGDNNHEGHSGWRIDQIDAQINGWMDSYQPKIVLLHIGTNDINQNYDVPNMGNRLSALIDKICAKLPSGGKLYVAKIIPESNSGWNQQIINYNNQIPGIVQSKVNAGKPVYMVDMYSALTTADLADGVHPNDLGYAKMSDVWFKAIKADLTNLGQGTNIAYGKTATVSTSYSADYAGAKALDGDTITRWAANGSSKPQWLKVDLGANSNITRVETQMEFGERWYQYKIEYSTDNVNWSLYADRSTNTTAQTLYVDYKNITARYLRITATNTQNAGDWICIWEFQVYNDSLAASFGDKCNGGTISVSNTSSPAGEDMTKAFDDVATTKWLVVSPTGWIQYDFAGSTAWAVNQYTITSANDYPARDPKNWTLLGSNDGTNWVTLDTRSNETFAARFQKKTYSCANTTAYQIYRLNITANNSDPLLQLAEIEMFITGVTFYQDADWSGTASQTLAKGTYTMAQLSALGCPNDWMSSLKVPTGWTVIVYADDNFTGTSWTFTANSNYVGDACNDKMTSCRIQ